MWLREKYRQDFEEIVDLVWNIYNKRPVFPEHTHLRALKDHLLESQRKHSNNFVIQKEDVSQQLSLLWLGYEKKWKQKQTHVSLRHYLIQCSPFGMRTWFNRQISVPLHGTPPTPSETRTSEFQLDLGFLRDGTSYWPLCNLSPYERYLIFLKFSEDKSIVEMTYTVQRHREVVSKQLRQILNRLRSEINESTDTR